MPIKNGRIICRYNYKSKEGIRERDLECSFAVVASEASLMVHSVICCQLINQINCFVTSHALLSCSCKCHISLFPILSPYQSATKVYDPFVWALNRGEEQNKWRREEIRIKGVVKCRRQETKSRHPNKYTVVDNHFVQYFNHLSPN